MPDDRLTVFDSLADFLPPKTRAHVSLEYDWDPFSEVIVFAVDDSFSNTDRWYTNHPHFNIYLRECNDYDPGQLTYYFKHDAELRSVIVMLADGTVPEAVAELDSYVGSNA